MDTKAELKPAGPLSGSLALDLYLDLLKRSLTDTLREQEPNHDSADRRSLFVAFTHHYINGTAVTMLPLARIDNIRYCIEQVVRDGVPGDVIETGVWRGGACIFMRGCLKGMGITDRTVWVADSFEGLPDPAPEREKEFKFHNSPSMQKSLRK
jgi:O-methyltransferase